MNRTLLDKSRSMLEDAGLPKSLWGEAVLTAAYLLNRSPTSALEERKTPFEKWYDRKPNIDKLHIFGSVAYTWIPKEKRSKLDPKSEKNVMIGYTTNGYRVWNPRKKVLFTSRDVVFDERRSVKPTDEPVRLVMLEPKEKEEEICTPSDDPVKLVSLKSDEQEEEDICSKVGDRPEVHLPESADEQLNEEYVSADEEEEPTGALPSQQERDNCTAEVSTRQSGRERRIPGKFFDFITGLGATTAAECFAGSTSTTDDTVMAYALNAETFVENLPTTIDGLMKRSDWPHWKDAINSELESLLMNETWELIPKPAGKNLVDCKWFFKVKRDEYGEYGDDEDQPT